MIDIQRGFFFQIKISKIIVSLRVENQILAMVYKLPRITSSPESLLIKDNIHMIWSEMRDLTPALIGVFWGAGGECCIKDQRKKDQRKQG